MALDKQMQIGSMNRKLCFLLEDLGILSFLEPLLRCYNINESCNKTWEEEGMKRTMVPLTLTWTWLCLLAVGSVYGIIHWKDLAFYHNYWNRAVQIMDMNVTYGAWGNTVFGNIEFVVVFIVFIIMYATESVELLHETAAMVANSFYRFYARDMNKWGRASYTEADYRNDKANLTNMNTDAFKDPMGLVAIKLFGFMVMLFGLYGARSFTVTFYFFCRVLRNAAWIWNERFRNHLLNVKPDPVDQTKRRMDDKILIKDHLILVQLFKMTEENFCVVLQFFYFAQILNLIMLLYGFSLLTTTTSCHMYWEDIDSYNCSETAARVQSWINPKPEDPIWVSFENPMVSPENLKLQDVTLNFILFLQCIYQLAVNTTTAATTYEEAMRGWQILRRHSFMTAKTTKQRNFMHSLIISFARNNPLQISAGGYFVVNKQLLVTILLTVLVYFTIMIQFAPGEIDMQPFCNGQVMDRNSMSEEKL